MVSAFFRMKSLWCGNVLRVSHISDAGVACAIRRCSQAHACIAKTRGGRRRSRVNAVIDTLKTLPSQATRVPETVRRMLVHCGAPAAVASVQPTETVKANTSICWGVGSRSSQAYCASEAMCRQGNRRTRYASNRHRVPCGVSRIGELQRVIKH